MGETENKVIHPAEEVFDSNAETYSEGIDSALGKYGATHDFFMAHKAWLIRDILRKLGRNPASVRLLDVGCGVGKIHEYLKDDFCGIAGVDVSKASIEVAKRTYPSIDYKSYDGRNLPYENATFDLSIAICVFHHVPPADWSAMAAEMLRVLRPKGLTVVIEHNPYNPVTRHIVDNCPIDADAVLLSASKLQNIFRDAGAKDVSTRTIVSVPPINRVMKAIDGLLGTLPFGAQYYLVAHPA